MNTYWTTKTVFMYKPYEFMQEISQTFPNYIVSEHDNQINYLYHIWIMEIL